jgi:hypothetical protein
MARKVLESCPSCGGKLEITEVHCLDCDARVQAHFGAGDFNSLNEEQSTFLRLFVTSRGNLSEVEKRLGVSYPTVRAKLDEIIARLETPHSPSSTTGQDGTDRASDARDARAWGARASLGETLRAEVGATVRAALDEVFGRVASPPPSPRPTTARPTTGAQGGEPGARGTREDAREPEASPRRVILDAVARGELSPTEGVERIRQLGGEE